MLEAERWGDEVLQGVARRVIDAALLRRPAAMESYLGDKREADVLLLVSHEGDRSA